MAGAPVHSMRFADAVKAFHLRTRERDGHFARCPEVTPSAHLPHVLERGATVAVAMGTAKATSERVVAPVLQELLAQTPGVSLFSGVDLSVDPAAGLTGSGDFLISRSEAELVLTAPVVVIVGGPWSEDGLDEALGQCVAGMVAARIFNQRKGNDIPAIHGAVTNATVWELLCLSGQTVTADRRGYTNLELGKLLGILQAMALGTAPVQDARVRHARAKKKPGTEAWWEAVGAKPEAFTDPVSVALLLDGAMSPDPAKRAPRRYALARVVKALEGESGTVSWRLIVDRLPELAEGLADTDDGVQGCTISIMRRIRPTAQTVERLVDVFDRVAVRDRNGVIEALGNCEASAWSPRVERLLVACTGDPEHNNVVHAVEALCFKARLPETVDALVSLLKGGSPILDTVLRTLGILLSGSLGPRVAQRLEEIRTSAPEDVRLAISTRLGEWPADLAPPLLAPYAADPSPAVRAAAEASLARYAPPVGEG